jgi:hypothetical protein
MIKQKLFENFAHPRGLWGRLGQVMAHKSANIERGKWALAELDPQPHDRLLELGYGRDCPCPRPVAGSPAAM